MPAVPAEAKFSPIDEARSIYYFLPVFIIVWGIVAFRFWKFARREEESSASPLKAFFSSSIARDFIAIFVLGAGSGLLYLLLGHAFDYSRWIMSAEHILFNAKPLSDEFVHVSLTTFGLITGVLIASLAAHQMTLTGLQLPLVSYENI